MGDITQIVEGPFYMLGRPELEKVYRAFRDLEDLDNRLIDTGMSWGNEAEIYKLAGIVMKDDGREELDVFVTGYKKLLVTNEHTKNRS